MIPFLKYVKMFIFKVTKYILSNYHMHCYKRAFTTYNLNFGFLHFLWFEVMGIISLLLRQGLSSYTTLNLMPLLQWSLAGSRDETCSIILHSSSW